MANVEIGWIAPSGPVGGAGWDTYLQYVERGLRLIAGRYGSAWMSDHLQMGDRPRLEGWTALTFLAARHPGLRFGHTVLAQSFRNPALLAKMAATLSFLTGGRYNLGIGTGWHEAEHRAFGYDFPPAGVRVEQLAEAVQIVKALWSEERATFEGEHYHVNEARGEPRPVPAPPITMAGTGPRMLRLIARYADWWDVERRTVDQYRGLVTEMERACEEVGRDPRTLRRSCWFSLCACARTEQRAIALAGASYGRDVGLVGTPDQIVEQLQPYIELGAARFELGASGFPDLTTLELLAGEVAPRIRELYRNDTDTM